MCVKHISGIIFFCKKLLLPYRHHESRYVEQKPENQKIHTKGNYIFFDASHRGNVNFEFDGCNDIVMENINQY